MNGDSERSIRCVIGFMYENPGERITIDDLAHIAMFSKFHFTRIFQQATGVSPGRFLSAIRLQEAKNLLLSTSLSITEISHQVGYSSVGTFSSRFKKSVGLSPTAYRDLRGFAPHISTDARATRTTVVQGTIAAAADTVEGPVFVGLFRDTIPQGVPIRCTVLERPGIFRLDNVPDGEWCLLAQSVPAGQEGVIGEEPPAVGSHGPLRVRHGVIIEPLDITLRAMDALDPPVLLALLDARQVALGAAASRAGDAVPAASRVTASSPGTTVSTGRGERMS